MWLHRDKSNVGPSFIKATGCSSGGELNYYPGDDGKVVVDKLELPANPTQGPHSILAKKSNGQGGIVSESLFMKTYGKLCPF